MSTPDKLGDDLLAAFRAEKGPRRSQADRLWARLQTDVARAPRRRSAAPPVARPRRVAVYAAVVFATAAAAIVAVWPRGEPVRNETAHGEGSMAAHGAPDDETARPVAPIDADPKGALTIPEEDAEPNAGDPSRDTVDVTNPADPAEAIPRERGSARRPGARTRTPPIAEPSRSEDSLGEETSLLRRARAALSAGQASAALEILADYDRRFGAGRLAEEADAVRTMARCRQAPDDPGALADAFAAAHPSSLFRKQVVAACTSAQKGDPG